MCVDEDHTLHENIAKVCLQCYNSLSKTGKPKPNEWTILSCIVEEFMDKFEVVALGTGSKCLGQDKMSPLGDILNDSHAEVMCRRSFLKYIYENMLAGNSEKFEFDSVDQKFTLRNGLKFHFFTTHVPCGDAAIFPKQNEDFGMLLTNNEQNTLKRRHSDESDTREIEVTKSKIIKTDIFRTGAKCLENDIKRDSKEDGFNYHVTGVVRTKPGRGTQTLSVSCSDKLARWFHLGIQGALLSILLKNPIYLSSFTIAGGTPFNRGSMQRALVDRFENIVLKAPYKYNCQFQIGQANVKFTDGKCASKNPCPSSISWINNTKNKRQMEVAVDGRRQGVTKRQLQTNAGRLQICKLELFRFFLQIVQKYNLRFQGMNNLKCLTYKEAKSYARDYQQAWSVLKEAFKIWTSKDTNLLKFCID